MPIEGGPVDGVEYLRHGIASLVEAVLNDDDCSWATSGGWYVKERGEGTEQIDVYLLWERLDVDDAQAFADRMRETFEVVDDA